MEQKPQDIALSKAKVALMSKPDSAFFGHLAFSLVHYFDDSVPTAATNGTKVKYNTKFFMDLDREEQLFLMLHETLHCAYLHMIRDKGKDKERFNIAADHVINLQLIERGFRMPACGLADPRYKGMSAEQVYDLLPPSPPGVSIEGFGSDLEAPDGTPEETQQQMEDILVMAAVQSQLAGDKPGTIPGEIQLFLDNLLSPKLPWRKLLQKYLNSFAKNDYSFKKPNRRFFPQHYMPSLFSTNLMDFAAFTDISGSVTDQEYKQQVSETASILRMMKPKKMTFGQFDTEIKSVHEIKSVQELMNVEFTGRGGTCIEPVIEWANTNKPQLLMIFTDGEFYIPSDLSTKVDVLWLIYNNPTFTAPFGKVIHYAI